MNRIVVVFIERGRARFFDVGPVYTAELAGLHSPFTPRVRYHREGDAPGEGERAWHGRFREEERRHVAAVAARVEALARDSAVELVLAGPPALTNALSALLPPPLAERVVGTTRFDPRRLTPAIVQQEARRLQGAWVAQVPD